MTFAVTKPQVAIACGGTGGHLFPGLAVAEQLVKRGCGITLLVSPKEVDQQAVRGAQGLQTVTLPAVGLQGGNYLGFARRFWQSWRAARKLFREHPPHAALAMGGFTSAPPILAARKVRAKTFIHESNAIPGRANRWLARLVDQAFVGFPAAATRLHSRETTVMGTPVRTEFRPADSNTCCATLGLDPGKPVLLIMGGSQGASGVNQLILSALPILIKRAPHWQWLHLTGAKDFETVKSAFATLGVKSVVHPFFAEMHQMLGAATVAVSRAGASSLAELAAMRLPALLVPFPYAADNHQFHNARAFAKTGAAWLIEQRDASPEKVANLLVQLMENATAREKIQSALDQWHAPKAAERMAEMILQMVARSAEFVAQVSRRTQETQLDFPTSQRSSRLA